MNSSDKNPAMETFERLQRKTAVPIILVVALVALIANGASIWMFPIVLAIAAVYFFAVLGGARLAKRRSSR
jgi:hypothetical protein